MMNNQNRTRHLLAIGLCTVLCIVLIQAAATSEQVKSSEDKYSADPEQPSDTAADDEPSPDSDPSLGAEPIPNNGASSDTESSSNAEPSDTGSSSDVGPSSDNSLTSDSDVGPALDDGPVPDDGDGLASDQKPDPVGGTDAVSPTSGPQYPGITLYNGSEICFRANHYGQILITYYTSGLSKVNDVYNGQTKILTRTLDFPDKRQLQGTCGKERITFSLTWGDGNYTLTLDFVQKTSDGEVHFEAPSNFSYECRTEEDITLYVLRNGSRDQSVIESVDISVWDVKIQAFEVPQTGVFSEGASCKPDIDKNIPHQNIVPVAVAACLAGVIVVIVIAYFFIKKRPSTQYSAME
ncbi:hypothetical protein LSH36_154g09000 [Paralvinella palmiformis]|uniref:Uncharacterized protein n=1 Tax=Paralvinella palmiformis TaxID=53620 RepID=A0AAD9JU76_9ANNE|nr:hypothetical protein LSH36_154g09000 [Paralvinella palmiformis]